jgi:hypothetical protein
MAYLRFGKPHLLQILMYGQMHMNVGAGKIFLDKMSKSLQIYSN